MAKYLTKRLLAGLLTLFILATVTFFMMKAMPGSPFGGDDKKVSVETLEKLNAKYNLDKPILQQYTIYMKNAIQGDFGESMLKKGRQVSEIISNSIPATIKLGFVTFVISMVVGITLGTVAALTKKQWVTNFVMMFSTIGVSVPNFLLALLLMILFGVTLRWFPILGLKTPMHYVLPAIALSLQPISMISRLTRSSMMEVMRQDYMVLAKSKGSSRMNIIVKHGLKNAMLPVITYAGPLIASLMTGSFVIEKLFTIPGIGAEFVNSVTNRDYTLIMALTLLLGAFVIVMNIISDLLNAMIDPRIKLKG